MGRFRRAPSSSCCGRAWGQRWPDRLWPTLGDDKPGDASKLHFPSYGPEAAEILIRKRRVSMIGVDTASNDPGTTIDYPVHQLAAANNVAGLENLANLEELPPVGATVIALPMKIAGAPARGRASSESYRSEGRIAWFDPRGTPGHCVRIQGQFGGASRHVVPVAGFHPAVPAAVLGAYYLSAERPVLSEAILILASLCLLYAWWDARFVPLLIGQTDCHLADRRASCFRFPSRAWIVFGIAANLAVLAFFKYLAFVAVAGAVVGFMGVPVQGLGLDPAARHQLLHLPARLLSRRRASAARRRATRCDF